MSVLVLHDVHKPFSVYCDASYTSLGCALMQEVWGMDIPWVPMNTKTCHGLPGRFSPRPSNGIG
jgi:hypothetical protein